MGEWKEKKNRAPDLKYLERESLKKGDSDTGTAVFLGYGDKRDVPSFTTRRSVDLETSYISIEGEEAVGII